MHYSEREEAIVAVAVVDGIEAVTAVATAVEVVMGPGLIGS